MADDKVEKLVGKISHYFSKIGVAIIDLVDSLKKGDTIKIKGSQDKEFTQVIDSMEVEHQQVDEAKKGDSVGIKIDEKVKEGYQVYKT